MTLSEKKKFKNFLQSRLTQQLSFIKFKNELYDRTGVSNPNGRFLEEPNPIENGEIANCEIIEEEGEEEIVGGHFHNTLESLYKKNTNL